MIETETPWYEEDGVIGSPTDNPEIVENRRAYLAGLRSDKFVQAHGTFTNYSRLDGKIECCAVMVGIHEMNGMFADLRGANLDRITKWLGLDSKDQAWSIVSLNDNEFWSFEKIADFLEEKWGLKNV